MRLSISQTPSNTASNTPTNTNSGTPCPTTSATPTQTPTVSTSAPPPCPEEITLTWLGDGFDDFNGTYYRQTSYTGGTFDYGWLDNDPEVYFHTGTSPDGNNYYVYLRTVGTTAYTLTNYYFQPTSVSRQYTIFKTEGSIINSQVVALLGAGGIGYTGTTIGGAYTLTSGLQYGSGNQPIYFAYPPVCPTSTPTPSITATNTATPTLTPSPTFCADPKAVILFDSQSGRTQLAAWMITQPGVGTFRGLQFGSPSPIQSTFQAQMNAYISYSGWGVNTFGLIQSGLTYNQDPIQLANYDNQWTDDFTWVSFFVPECSHCPGYYANVGANDLSYITSSFWYSRPFYYSGTTIPQGNYTWYTTYTGTGMRNSSYNSQYILGNLVCTGITPTPTITTTNTATPSATPTNTPTLSPTQTQTQTQTNTGTQQLTPTNTSTPTRTPEITPSMTQTNTPSNTSTQTNTPTNTATQTITPTPSPTKVASYCIEAMNTGFGDYSFNYINCDNVLTFITIPGNDSGLLFVYCGSNPASQSGTGYAVQQPTECVDCSCPPEPPPTPSMTASNTATQTNTPTNTATNTNTPTNTATPTSTPPIIDYCSYVVINTQPSLDIPIYDVYVNGVQVSYLSGANWTITPANSPGTFTTSQTGATQTVAVYYGANIAGQRIEILDCNEVTQCQNINPGGGIATFTDVAVSCGCYWSINGYDGTC